MSQYYGLDNLDERLAQYIPESSGFFVELGAFDGVTQSNSLYFEQKGWRGILIEPIPPVYQVCVRNRPNATVVNCACVSEDFKDANIEMTWAGLMSIVKGARKSDEADDEWVRRGEEIQNIKRADIRVPARTLSSILDQYKAPTIDLLSLDVEGFEIGVLKGLDFTRHAPRNLLVEESDTDDIEDYLRKKGYMQVANLSRRPFTKDMLYRPDTKDSK